MNAPTIIRHLIGTALLAGPLAGLELDYEYSRWTSPEIDGGGTVGVQAAALSSNGLHAAAYWHEYVYEGAVEYPLPGFGTRWTVQPSATTALRSTAYPGVRPLAISSQGLAVGELYTSLRRWEIGFPMSASGSVVTRRGTIRGRMAHLDDAGQWIVGTLWPTAPATTGRSVFANARSRLWNGVTATPTNPLAGTSQANAPSMGLRISPNGRWIAGAILDPTTLSGTIYIKDRLSGAEPALIPPPFQAPGGFEVLAVSNTGEAVMSWGSLLWEDNFGLWPDGTPVAVEGTGYQRIYRWNGTALTALSPEEVTISDGSGWSETGPVIGARGSFAWVGGGMGLMGIMDIAFDVDDMGGFHRAVFMYRNGGFDPDPVQWVFAPANGGSCINAQGQILSGYGPLTLRTPLPRVSLVGGNIARGEQGGPMALTVSRGAGPFGPATTTWPLTVKLRYGGTAQRGVDYLAPLTVTIPAGKTSVGLTLTPINDALAEDAEAISISIVSQRTGDGPRGSYLAHGTAFRTGITLMDDDAVARIPDRSGDADGDPHRAP
ncbi:MAG: hypothetical protein RLZZ127_138 [Planctomycetota bacterium]|jgi:hypothetical protein